MSPCKSLEVERLSREIDNTRTWLAGAKAVESFDLAATLEREMTEKQDQKDKLLAEIESDALDEQRGTAPSTPSDSFQAVIASVATQAEPSESIDRIWRLTPADVDRVKKELELMRNEILARQAQEIKSLEAEGTELDSLEQAIDIFVRKFGTNSAVLERPARPPTWRAA